MAIRRRNSNTKSLKKFTNREDVRRVLEFGEEAIDTLAEVTLRLQKAYHDLVEEEKKPKKRTTRVALVKKKRVKRG